MCVGVCGCVWWQAGCSDGWHRKSKISGQGATVGRQEIEQELSVPGDGRGVLPAGSCLVLSNNSKIVSMSIP